MGEPAPEVIVYGDVSLEASPEAAVEATVESMTPDPESIWVYDHTEICGNKMRVHFKDLASFENRMRGECPTCMSPLGVPRLATEGDW